MKKIVRLPRCLRASRNVTGRDFVVSDLHGHRALLERELERASFDPARDRVFSVGDLVDRGPASLDTLALIEQPWFHAVLGNHELMLLNRLGCFSSRVHARKAHATRGGAWVESALAQDRSRLCRLVERLAEMPLAIHVDAEVPFNVTHSDLHALGARQESLYARDSICVHEVDAITNSRVESARAQTVAHLELHFGSELVRVGSSPVGRLPITYVGHTQVSALTVHQSYVFIERGTGRTGARGEAPRGPTLLEHRRFAYWLGGVAAFREVGGTNTSGPVFSGRTLAAT